jgi:sulfite reductase (NADPH) flavoprotein alpha-component
METRLGAANVLLGYVFSPDSDPGKKAVAKSIIASSASLLPMRSALDQLTLLYNVSSPFVAHVAAVDFDVASSLMVTDYVSAMTIAQETSIGLITSFSAYEAQHMALFATLAATVLPAVHIYDGVQVSRESTKVVDVLDQGGLQNVFSSILQEQNAVSKKVDQATRMNDILKSLNAELGTAYSMFEYEGHNEPDAVLVVFGSVESSLATQVAAALAKGGEKVGVIAVRVYRPFSESYFLEALPKSVKRIAVLGQVSDRNAVEDATVQSALYVGVVAATSMSDIWSLAPPTLDLKYPREQVWSPKQFAWIFDQIVRKQSISIEIPEDALTSEASALDSFDLLAEEEGAKQYIFWDSDDAPSVPAASIIARLLAEDTGRTISFSATYDNAPLAGIFQAEIKSSKKVVEASFHVESADVTVVNDIALLFEFDLIARTKQGGILILKSTIKDEDIEKKLPAPFKRDVVQKGVSFIILDPSVVAEDVSGAVENALVQLAFLRIADVPVSLEKLSAHNLDPEAVHIAAENLDDALRKVETPKEWAEAVDENESTSLPAISQTTSFAANEEKHAVEPSYILKSNQSAAQAFSFKEAYGAQTALRPDLGIRNYVVKVKENKRLTPDYYDRNIFHIEFDLTGTGMEYQIGEALGIHAQNDPVDVTEFIKFYGLNADDIVEVPSRDDPEVLEVRTVFQVLSQNVDIFGRPPKRFYEALATFADDIEEKKALLALSSAEGAAEFKRRAEVDTCTFADTLLEYPSAHPNFHDLVKIVSPMKRREYSIASSQVVHPNAVHLLIVVVNWVDPKGRNRFGQATRFLSTLPVGTEVTVSVKPSVMKLPPLSTQPLIMAGLGTGLAPFRAFVQYRAWQKAQGMKIGSILLYMGSRHQREEYLYGEEWEAYQAAGIVTLLGRAFSRDQPEKIYIQDRMRQTVDEIIQAYIKEEGAFYLCGPTWPVPDVTEVLCEAIMEDGRREGKKVDGAKKIDELKDGGRYVLEVY